MENWKLETAVNYWVKGQLENIGLVFNKDFRDESNFSEYMKRSLKGSAKTANKTNFGKPDFHIEGYEIPVVIEDKVNLKKLVAQTKDGIKNDDDSVKNFAVNGALYYARNMISSGGYKEVVAIGVAGDNEENVTLKVYYVFGSGPDSQKAMDDYKSFDFLQNKKTFAEFYKEAVLSEEEKHQILIDSQAKLQTYAGKLNKLMHNHNITAPQRVLYVSGMLLAMQDLNQNGYESLGITPDFLNGSPLNGNRDGQIVVNRVANYLQLKQIPEDKRQLMLSSFNEISKDADRDKPTKLDKEVAKYINGLASANKQIFTFIYENIYKSIDGMAGTLDIMGEMYSEFLKYALGDGKEIGIVLTPPYVTKMMTQILNVNQNSRVMDLATGSAGFLIASMEEMINDAEKGRKGSEAANKKVKEIKERQLLGVELNAEMFTLAATNMILRGDGSSNIQKGNTFDTPASLYQNFQADRLLLNPPFSFEENGMPFIAFGLDKMQKGGLGAIIIQDSAGSGKAIKTNQLMLTKHTLVASIKMPVDLFMPMAGVQTSIYVFKVGTPHDFDVPVKFIDFRNDGYKRTKRSLQEIDAPTKRYMDIVKIYKAGKAAKNLQAGWNLDEIYVEDQITNSGADWNFDQHKKIDTKPTFDDFRKTVADYLAWEVDQILKSESFVGK